MSPIRQHYSSTVNQYELSSRLLSLTENDASYTLTQINGQRIFKKAPHAWHGPEPSRKCEVFIGRIPHDCFEDTLVPLFRRAGDLFEFRLMINFSGWNRGYAFAMYATEAEASNAIRMFNNYMIRPAWLLGVCPSINNCRIYISRIPSTTPSADIVRLLYALTDEVQEVRIRRSMASCAAIVEYRSHRGAAIARKALVAAASAAWGAGARPVVDWSLPQSPQLLRQYREVGRWSPERGVELVRTAEEMGSPPPLAAAASYSLEPWVQVRRMRMIHEAAQRNTAAHNDWGNSSMSNDMGLFTTSMASLNLGGGGLGLEEERAVWSPVEPAAAAEDYLPALQRNGAEPFTYLNGAMTPAPRNGSVASAPYNIDAGAAACNGALAGGVRNGAVPLSSPGGGGGAGELSGLGGGGGGAAGAPDAFPSPPPGEFNPWTAYHPMQDFIGRKARESVSDVIVRWCGAGVRCMFRARRHVSVVKTLCCVTAGALSAAMPVCDKWVALKIVEFVFCVSCLVTKRVSSDDEARLALLLQKLSREWSLLTSVTWDSVGGAFADAVYGGYVIITFGLILARIFQEIPRGRRILEGIFLGFGLLFFLILGGLELASLDSIPRNLVVNASVLGSFSLVVAALFLLDLMGPRTYYANHHAQTLPISSPQLKEKKVSIVTAPTTNGNLANGKANGHTLAERPKDLDLEKNRTEVDTKKLETDLFDDHKNGFIKFNDVIEKELEKSKFGSVRNGGVENENYIKLTDPLTESDRINYERELAKFNERYFRDFLERVEGKLSVREDYLPELQTPVFSKVKTGRLKSVYDDVSPTYEQKRQSKSPSRAKTVSPPTLQQLEDYLRGSTRSRRSETPALFPMEPIEERDREAGETEGRASGTPTDPGYVQYTAGRWPDTRQIRTPRHSPT